MHIDVFAHILTPRYRKRVFEILDARGDSVAPDCEQMMKLVGDA